MTDIFDRASDREEEMRADALEEQRRRAGLEGKTVADSATHCTICGGRIKAARRKYLPGVQTCVECQADLEKATRPASYPIPEFLRRRW